MVNKADTVHLERVRPGIAPGGVWVRICTRDALLDEYAIPSIESAGQQAASDAARALPYLKLGETIRNYFYDGDSGECLCTLITERE